MVASRFHRSVRVKQIEYEGDKSRVYSVQGRGETMADIMKLSLIHI